MYRASLAAGRSGNTERGLAFADAGLALIDEAERPALAAHLLDQRAKHLRTLGRGSGAEEHRRGIELLRGDEHAVKRGYLLAGLAWALSLHGQLTEALAAAEEAVALCERSQDPCDALGARMTRAAILPGLGRFEEGIAMQRELRREVAALGPTPSLLTRIDIALSCELYDVGRYAEAVEAARAGLAEVVPCNRIQGGLLRNNLAEPLIALGEWEEAARHIDEAIDLNLPGVHDLGLLRIRADLEVLRGRYDEAQSDLDTARRRSGSKTGEPQYVIPLHRAVAGLAAARGRIGEARFSAGRGAGPRRHGGRRAVPLGDAGPGRPGGGGPRAARRRAGPGAGSGPG
jgi:tetratricopeptide (TPR) repeat protein